MKIYIIEILKEINENSQNFKIIRIPDKLFLTITTDLRTENSQKAQSL